MFKRYKKTVLALTLAVTLGLSSVTARVLSIPALSPVKEAHAILGGGGGGIMQMIPTLIGLFVVLAMLKGQNNNQGQPMLTQQQYDRQVNASNNLLNVNNNPQSGGNTVPNQNPNTTTSTLPQPRKDPILILKPDTNGGLPQIAVVTNPSSVNPNPVNPSPVKPQPVNPSIWDLLP